MSHVLESFKKNLSLHKAIHNENDELYVDFSRIRMNFRKLFLNRIGLERREEEGTSYITDASYTPESLYLLFCGHRGSGKSTELSILAENLKSSFNAGKSKCIPILISTEKKLNLNNISFPDVCVLIVETLITELEEKDIVIDDIYSKPLLEFFNEKIISEVVKKSYALDANLGLQSFFASLRAKFSNSAEHTELIRSKVETHFEAFAEKFYALLNYAEEKLQGQLLFIIDGTDKLFDIKKAEELFIHKVNLITKLRSRFIYAAPIGFALEANQAHNYYVIEKLPMIKLYENHEDAKDGKKLEENFELLREFVYKRIPQEYFKDSTTVDTLIRDSGGNPRHLIVLLEKALEFTTVIMEKEKIEIDSATTAGKGLYNMQFSFLEDKDVDEIKKVFIQRDHTQNDVLRRLMFYLAILEYNGDAYWKYPHPCLRYSPFFTDHYADK